MTGFQSTNIVTNRNSPSAAIRIAVILATLVALDQTVKLVMISWLGPDASTHRWELAGRYLAFQYVENRGAAFGILEGQSAILIVLAVAVAVGFVAMMRRELAGNRLLQLALTLIGAGAIGNLADRIRLGYVVDFISVGDFPKFNMADSYITIAVIVIAWTSFSQPGTDVGDKDQPID